MVFCHTPLTANFAFQFSSTFCQGKWLPVIPVKADFALSSPHVAAARTLLDQEGRIPLHKFHHFLFSNLEQAYYFALLPE